MMINVTRQVHRKQFYGKLHRDYLTGFSFQGKAVEKDSRREVAADKMIHGDSKPAYWFSSAELRFDFLRRLVGATFRS